MNLSKVWEKSMTVSNNKKSNVNSSPFADEDLVINKEDRAWWPTRWLLGHAGGYDPQYYTASEARSSTTMAAAKFVSVSFATFAFMKAVNPAFNNEAIQNLPSIGGIDPKVLATGVVASGLWWGISKLDTEVIHGMRSSRAAREAYKKFNLGTKDSTKTPLSGIFLRAGISLGSLGITIPALMVTASEDTIDQYLLKTRYNGPNNAIIQEYQGDLQTIEDRIKELTGSRAILQTSLTELQGIDRSATPAQTAQLETLTARLATLTQQKAEEETKLREQEQARDLAIDRIRQEREGIRGSVPGCRPEAPVAPICDAAMADRDLANRQITTIRTVITRYNNQIASINTDINNINAAIVQQGRDSRATVERERTTLSSQIESLTTQISEEGTRRANASDVNGLAKADPRYRHFNPDLSEQFEGYVEYMRHEAHPLEWGRTAAIALIIMCLELGVFGLAASRKLNAGEMRGYLADLAKSEQAIDTFKEIKDKLALEGEAEEGRYAEIRREITKEKLKAEIFEKALEEARSNPEILNRAIDDVIAELEKTWPKDPKPSNEPT